MITTTQKSVANNLSKQVVSFSNLLELFDGFLLDSYGVLRHAAGTYDSARKAINLLNTMHRPYLVVTNDASSSAKSTAFSYRQMGLAIAEEHILTSGMLIQDYFKEHCLTGCQALVLGPEASIDYVRLAGATPVPLSSRAEYDVLVVGDESGMDFLPAMNDAISSLIHLLEQGRRPHLLLPNPDILYPAAPGLFGLAAGSMALTIEAAIKSRIRQKDVPSFIRLGKPFPAIFHAAKNRMLELGSTNPVMVGDTLETDIKGARNAGLKSALVTYGLTSLESAINEQENIPDYILESL